MVSNLNSTLMEKADYSTKYKRLKLQLKNLIYENENFQKILKQAQQKYLSAKRDRNFLLDRLIQYEKPSAYSSGSDQSENSEGEEKIKQEPVKRKGSTSSGSSQNASKKRKPVAQRKPLANLKKSFPADQNSVSPLLSEGQLTPEEVERHLQSRQSFLELMSCRAPPTVPSELFSNDPSLDSYCFSESNEMELETSPDIGEDSYSVELPDAPE